MKTHTPAVLKAPRRGRALAWLPVLAALGATPARADEATWRIALRGGFHIHESQAFDFVSESSLLGASELELDRHIWGPVWVGAAWRGGGTQGEVYDDLTTSWSTSEVRVGALGRLRPWEPLAVYGRLGAAASFIDFELSGSGTLTAETWTPGAFAGLGVEFFPLHRALVSDLESDFGLGISFEATYVRYAPVDLEVGTTHLGRFDPSGPGWLMGLVVQW